MKITETDDEIILRDVPFGQWALGCVFSPFIGILLVALVASAIENPRSFFSPAGGGLFGYVVAILISVFFFGLILLTFAAIFSFILAPVKSTKINRQTKSIELKSRSLFKNRTQIYYFSQIKRFAADKIITRGAPLYSVVLVLANKKRIDLESKERAAANAEEIVLKLNSFINTKI